MISCFRIESQTDTTKWFKMHRSKVKKITANQNGIESDLESVSSYSKMVRTEATKLKTRVLSDDGTTANMPVKPCHRNGATKLKSDSQSTDDEEEGDVLDLPDGFCFNRSMQLNFTNENSKRECKYVGSFLITGDSHESRAEFVKEQLKQQDRKRGKAVLLVVSKSGIKVCSPKTKSVLMAHALRRISYATCDLPQKHFSFLAREPRGHFSLQYCHTFVTDTPQQAEELSRLVGEVFRMAFAQQLQQTPTSSFLDLCHQSGPGHRSPIRGGVNGSSGLAVNGSPEFNSTRFEPLPSSPGPSGIQELSRTTKGNSEVNWRSSRAQSSFSEEEMNGSIYGHPQSPARAAEALRGTLTERVWAKTVINKHHEPLVDRGAIRMSPLSPQRAAAPPVSLPSCAGAGAGVMTPDLWSPSSASSCEDNTGASGGVLGSPSEVNSCLQFKEKPQMVKKFESSWTTVVVERPVTLASVHDELNDELIRPGSGGYVNENAARNDDSETDSKLRLLHRIQVSLPSSLSTPPMSPIHLEGSERLSSTADSDFDSKRASQSSTSNSESTTSLNSEEKPEMAGCHGTGKRHSSSSGRSVVTPPPIPERHDSLSSQEEEEERELRDAPWFQAGIPREIALEILAQEPVGSFMVRESTSKPGCYALSLRVPRDFQPTGIAHYLIMRTQRGFKIKGFMKEFSTLTALITHHSVMPELLPCPLSLSRYNPVFRKQDTSEDLVDIEDPDYNLLADFRKVMADLKV